MIYEKEMFDTLPEHFWHIFLLKLRKFIENTGFPMFLIRVGICDKAEQISLYQKMSDSDAYSDYTFFDYWYFENYYIAIHINTIEWYIPNIDVLAGCR